MRSMNNTTTTPAAQLREAMIVDGNVDAEVADRMIAGFQSQYGDDFDAEALKMIETFYGNVAERDALRERLINDSTLRQAICPNNDWVSKNARFNAAATILDYIEAAVERAHEKGKPGYEAVTVDTIAAQLIVDKSTAQDTIEFRAGSEDHDPVKVGWSEMRYRIRDAVAAITQDARDDARRKRIADEDARWEAAGRKRCTRCGGAGGHHGWPGYTCFECGGERHLPA